METFLLLTFATISQTFSLPPGLLESVCYVESKHDIFAFNSNDGGSNSVGICQVKLSTARSLGYTGNERKLRDPAVNIFYAGKYLSFQLNRYHGKVHKAVAAYNAGRYCRNEKGGIKNYKYVDKVISHWKGCNKK